MQDSRYSVTVVGNMNPAIHQPWWYRALDLITQSEVDLSQNTFLSIPGLVRFSTPQVEIQCIPNKWTCSGRQGTSPERVLQLSKATFERLKDTPVSAFGLNFHVAVDVEPRTLAELAIRVKEGPFAPMLGEIAPEFDQLVTAYQLADVHVEDGRLRRRLRATVAVRTEPAPALQVAINVHHKIELMGVRIFDMSPMLDAAAPGLEVATQHAERLLSEMQEQ